MRRQGTGRAAGAARAWATAARALAAALGLLAALPARAEEVVRIAVVTDAPRVVLEARSLSAVALHEGAEPRPAGERAELVLSGDELRLNGVALDAAGAAFTAEGLIRCAGFAFRSPIEVRRGAGGLDVIHILPLEDYVAAVTSAEMPPAFPREALEAQAVASRTFAVLRKLEALAEGRSAHLGATVVSQVYRGSAGVDPRARAAAEATRGEVLVADHLPAEAYFHSACGGQTERGADALGRDRRYLASVRCGRCSAAPKHSWSVRVEADTLGRLAGLSGPATRVRVVERTPSGRASRVEIASGRSSATIGAGELRQRLGWDRLPSASMAVRASGGAFVFEGRGSGHGAGMCQWGAAGFAREGWGYRKILAHYYPGTEIVKMY